MELRGHLFLVLHDCGPNGQQEENGEMLENGGRQQVTVRGIVVAAGATAEDDSVVLETSEETEIFIDPDGEGGNLRKHLHEEVEARGVLWQDRAGRMVLRVRDFEVREWEEAVQDEWPG
jgi:hypothetical protein